MVYDESFSLYREGGIMANPNPHKARMKRRRRPKPGTVKQLTSVLWCAIQRLEDALASAEAPDTTELCKLTHALSQSASTYLKAVEVGEFEARLEALEAAQGASTTGMRRAA